jgi:hypothetical protein
MGFLTSLPKAFLHNSKVSQICISRDPCLLFLCFCCHLFSRFCYISVGLRPAAARPHHWHPGCRPEAGGSTPARSASCTRSAARIVSSTSSSHSHPSAVCDSYDSGSRSRTRGTRASTGARACSRRRCKRCIGDCLFPNARVLLHRRLCEGLSADDVRRLAPGKHRGRRGSSCARVDLRKRRRK